MRGLALTSFNEATAFRPWKFVRSPFAASSPLPLQ